MFLDRDGTLLRTALGCFLAGTGWGILSALAIYLGATRVSPRIPTGEVWRRWRERRVLWMLALVLGLVAAWGTSEQIIARYGLRDLFWLTQPAELIQAGRLGAGFGFLLVLTILTVVPVAGSLKRRRQSARAGVIK